MAFRNKRVRRFVLRVIPVAVALVALLISLMLVSNVQQDPSRFPAAICLGTGVNCFCIAGRICRYFSPRYHVNQKGPGARTRRHAISPMGQILPGLVIATRVDT